MFFVLFLVRLFSVVPQFVRCLFVCLFVCFNACFSVCLMRACLLARLLVRFGVFFSLFFFLYLVVFLFSFFYFGVDFSCCLLLFAFCFLLFAFVFRRSFPRLLFFRPLVVQQRGLFNDPATEINSLVHAIKGEMQALNVELDASQVQHEAYALVSTVTDGITNKSNVLIDPNRRTAGVVTADDGLKKLLEI